MPRGHPPPCLLGSVRSMRLPGGGQGARKRRLILLSPACRLRTQGSVYCNSHPFVHRLSPGETYGPAWFVFPYMAVEGKSPSEGTHYSMRPLSAFALPMTGPTISVTQSRFKCVYSPTTVSGWRRGDEVSALSVPSVERPDRNWNRAKDRNLITKKIGEIDHKNYASML